jgi:hypothetical protein
LRAIAVGFGIDGLVLARVIFYMIQGWPMVWRSPLSV